MPNDSTRTPSSRKPPHKPARKVPLFTRGPVGASPGPVPLDVPDEGPQNSPLSVDLSDLVYTAAEAARILKVRVDTVWDLVREGKLEATHISSRNIRITRNQLVRFLNANTATR